MTFQEALKKQQLGIDYIKVAERFRQDTPTHEDQYKMGMVLLKEVRYFMIEIKRTVGNFTIK